MPNSLVLVFSGVVRTFKAMDLALAAALAIVQSCPRTVRSFSLGLKGPVKVVLVSSLMNVL